LIWWDTFGRNLRVKLTKSQMEFFNTASFGFLAPRILSIIEILCR
jgi:hypothetical protein